MPIRKYVISCLLGMSLLSASSVMADQMGPLNIPPPHYPACSMMPKQNIFPDLTSQEKKEVKLMMDNLKSQVAPLVKQLKVLHMQLNGKLVTSNTPWSDIQPLIDQINKDNAEIITASTKTRAEIFQKVGVIMPPPPPRRVGCPII